MKLDVELNCTADEFFSLLRTSVMHDIKAATNAEISAEQIVSGYTYQKQLATKLGRKAGTIVTLTKIDPPYCYEAAFASDKGVNTIAYEIEALDGDRICVTYSEGFVAANTFAELNFKLMNFFYKKTNEKRVLYMLNLMEQHIQAERNQSLGSLAEGGERAG
ncbi:MAG: DUF3284 domain-containing protein [Oscillospiraceae bacterium]|nr:DUF3284 domain-containing protein [Oscillospiraceae bacterium]